MAGPRCPAVEWPCSRTLSHHWCGGAFERKWNSRPRCAPCFSSVIKWGHSVCRSDWISQGYPSNSFLCDVICFLKMNAVWIVGMLFQTRRLFISQSRISACMGIVSNFEPQSLPLTWEFFEKWRQWTNIKKSRDAVNIRWCALKTFFTFLRS